MKLILSRTSTNRLRSIAAYINQHNPGSARKVRQSILDACSLLVEHPFAGRLHRLNVRLFFVPRIPYVIYYRIDEVADQLVILTIRHTAQRGL